MSQFNLGEISDSHGEEYEYRVSQKGLYTAETLVDACQLFAHRVNCATKLTVVSLNI